MTRADTSSAAAAPATALEGFADATSLALLIIDGDGIITYVNEAVLTLFGYRRDEMVGRTLDLIIPERMRGVHSRGVARVKAGMPSRLAGKAVEVMALRRDGTEFPIELSICTWEGPDGIAMGGTIRDISERRERDARLNRLAHHDPLTGLANRVRFEERLAAELADGGGAAILLIELENLKKINDGLGHATGDSLLQAFAVRLAGIFGADALPARFAGDEFAVLLPGIADAAEAVAAARSVFEALAPSFDIGGQVLDVAVKLGVAVGPLHGAERDELLAAADLGLQQARTGSNGWRLYASEMRNAVTARRALADELLRAVANGELELHYQPQVELASGRIVGAEALLRWRHPERGLLLPGVFLPVLESHSLALHTGCWIVDEACRQAAEWRDAGLDAVRVAVNLFGAQVVAGTLAEVVGAALARHDLPAETLEVEVTETIMLDNDERVLGQFHALRERGVGVAFDDFGTGHASLSTLKCLPLSTLKIDRSFVRDLLFEPTDAAIVEALLGMSRGMMLDVVAEGIETEEQRQRLHAMGCRLGQGFLFGRACPPQEFAQRLASNGAPAMPRRHVFRV